jgi:hypothetical protein
MPRSAALIALAALAVHQLRYLAAYGSGAHDELLRQGHAYLSQVVPILIGFCVATLAATLIRAALRATATGSSAIAPLRLRVLVYAVAIVSVFAVQETTEGLLVAGHTAGIAAVLGAGGWLALPLATFFGALCAALDGGLAKLESLLTKAVLPLRRPRAPRRQGAIVSRTSVPLASLPLAFGLARRPPPLLR